MHLTENVLPLMLSGAFIAAMLFPPDGPITLNARLVGFAGGCALLALGIAGWLTQ